MPESLTDRIASAFGDCTLPEEEWSHEAHLRVGLWHLLRYSPGEALRRLRDGIRTFNRACGIANTDSSGYHETITRFYVVTIAQFLQEQQRGGQSLIVPVDEVAARLVERLGDQHLLLDYYSRERLMSSQARRQWIEPDLKPLPDSDIE